MHQPLFHPTRTLVLPRPVEVVFVHFMCLPRDIEVISQHQREIYIFFVAVMPKQKGLACEKAPLCSCAVAS